MIRKLLVIPLLLALVCPVAMVGVDATTAHAQGYEIETFTLAPSSTYSFSVWVDRGYILEGTIERGHSGGPAHFSITGPYGSSDGARLTGRECSFNSGAATREGWWTLEFFNQSTSDSLQVVVRYRCTYC